MTKEQIQATSAPSQLPAEFAQKKKTGLATASLVCGICGVVCPITNLALAGIAGIICGHMASRRIREKPDEYDGAKRAKAGLSLSYSGLILFIFYSVMNSWLKASTEQILQQMRF